MQKHNESCHFVPSSVCLWYHEQGSVASFSNTPWVNLFLLFIDKVWSNVVVPRGAQSWSKKWLLCRDIDKTTKWSLQKKVFADFLCFQVSLHLCFGFHVKQSDGVVAFFSLVRIGQDQSTVAQWAETTVAESSLTSCVWAHFLIGSHTVPGQQHGSPLQLHWVKNVCMLRCNLPPAFWAEWLGSFSCHCSNVGV